MTSMALPDALCQQHYGAKVDLELAAEVIASLASHHAQGDDTWGLDHGAWSVLNWLYPNADVPVFQLSVDMSKDLNWHLSIGQTLSELRDQGVLILGSGNIIHNLRAMKPCADAFEWTLDFDTRFVERLENRDLAAFADRTGFGNLLHQAHSSIDHYLPASTIAGASDQNDKLVFTNWPPVASAFAHEQDNRLTNSPQAAGSRFETRHLRPLIRSLSYSCAPIGRIAKNPALM